jgi:hypothetical protein
MRNLQLKIQKAILHCNQDGQIIIVLLLTMLVALTIGLTITQRAVTNVATSTQTEQSSRAFAAAEAGINQAIANGAVADFTLSGLVNEASANVQVKANLPSSGQALEYPPIDKKTTAQFWLADPNTLAAYYNRPQFNIFFGNDAATLNSKDNTKPAIEVNVIVLESSNYVSYKYYYDADGSSSRGGGGNGFNNASTSCTGTQTVNTQFNPASQFKCQVQVPPADCNTQPAGKCSLYNRNNGQLMMARVRLLYTDFAHKIALAPVNGDLPPQASIYLSTGLSGQSRKKLQSFRLIKVSPQFLDFAIFSAADIKKL